MTSRTISAQARTAATPFRYRSIFISDVHLGFRGCQAEHLLDFLRHAESDHLYLVGDIVDGWRLQKKWFWPQAHAEILDRLLARADDGTRVVYLPGNHDDALRKLVGRSLGKVEVVHETIHETADGRRLLVVHGDVYDTLVREMRWLAVLGSFAYDTSLRLNDVQNAVRRNLGLGYWPMSAYLKNRLKAAVKFVERFETALAAEAQRRQVCGVVCGHVHKPDMRTIENVLYLNGGDWVENCSALVEHMDGRLELLDWARRRSMVLPPVEVAIGPLPEEEPAAA